MKTAVALCAFLAAIVGTAAPADPIVTVTGGQIRGMTLAKGGAVFKGIPFAQPPVGDLRWRDPRPVSPWTGVRDATAFGAPCPQSEVPFFPGLGVISKEDCLSLNIWTSTWPPQGNRAVMVWIPGGGNLLGGSADPVFNGEALADRDVVLITVNYRLGSFGFFSHPALTRESPHHSSGNQGLLDQILALTWVHDNVARFGGDPDKVTIFGNSAGSLNVGALMTSPLSKGLFRRVIGQSGPVILSGDPETLTQAEQRGESMAGRWKTPAEASLRELRAVPKSAVVEADVEASDHLRSTPPNLGITIDGYVLPRPPANVFATGQEHRVALLLGNNSRENFPGSAPPADLTNAIDEAYGPMAARARLLYGGAAADTVYGTTTEQWMTDTSFRCATVAQLLWHAASGATAYEYEFARAAPGREAFGSIHGSEVPYVFGTVDRGFTFRPATQPSAVDAQISEVMQQYWINFAKTGNPNRAGLPTWPPFGVSSRAYIQFTDAGPIGREGLRRPFCDLFIANVKRLIAQ